MLLLSLLAGASARAETIPWVLPWNDASPGITDFSSLNPPITTNRVAVDAEGHFAVNGKRVRFLGVNFAGDSPFMPTNNADAVAARLAKFGVNSVRFHHMDASWAYNGGLLAYTGTTSTNFNSAQLERVHFLVSRLKAHGIYSDINLLVGRSYRPYDGLGAEAASMDWKDAHILGYFYTPALELQKDYATRLLSPTNRFTGLPLAKDPAVGFVEIINENGLVQKWLDGGLDRLPSRYSTSLQARWNDWLRARYTNEQAVLAAWHIIDQPLGPNLLANGSFSNGLTGWVGEQHYAATATFSRTYEFTAGQPCAKIAVTTPDTGAWYIQLNYPGVTLNSNQVYTLSFWAKSSPSTNADTSIMQAHADWANLGYSQGLALTPNWQQFSGTFMPSASDANARVNFGSMGNKLATFWYADVRLQAGGQLGTLPPGSSLLAGTIPNLRYTGTGFTGTREARRDWLRFLRDLEYEYYDTMTAHLRDNIGYSGLIFGTIMATSPATVQNRLDVIDSHAYWQHPQFPGQPWDSVNWRVPNISMVNTLGDDNTLAGIARQRIKGKPFVVTEYQHPSPAYYGAEGPLMLAAYAGLQDWDGIWLFDYGHGNPTAGMGYVRGFFEIGQHPTKMPSLLLAANLFQRGDVRPAIEEYTLALTPDRELDLLQNTWAWGLFSGGQLGMPGKLAFTRRIDTDVGSDAAGLPSPPPGPTGNILTSDTGELRWDASIPNAGILTMNTPRTKVVTGFTDNHPVDLGGITITPGQTLLGWSSIGVTLVRGEVFTNDCSALIVASGWWENTGQVWTDSSKDSVGNQWGHSPSLAEVVPFTVRWPVGTNQVRVWALDEQGHRKASIPVSGDNSSFTLTITSTSGSMWYEVEVARWMTSFDLWRLRYFTAEEQLEPSISGEAGTPDGDGVPNLLKYYLGLPGRTPAPPGSLPAGQLRHDGSNTLLAISYDCDDLAVDVSCEGEVSPDLHTWFSGPAYTRTEPPVDLGALSRLTVLDLTPAVQTSRFMRLKLQRQ